MKQLFSILIILAFFSSLLYAQSYDLLNQIIKTEHIILVDQNAICQSRLIENGNITFNLKSFVLINKHLDGYFFMDSLIDTSDLVFIKQQFLACKKNQYWEKDSLPEFVKLYKLKKFIPLIPMRWNIKRHNPPSELKSFSFPIFNKDMDVAFIEREWYMGFGSGGSDLYIYLKINGKWTEYAVYPLWKM